MSLAEVNRAVKAYTERKRTENRDKAYFDYTHSLLIALFISKYIFGSDVDMSFYKTYSNLYEEEYIEEQEQIKMDTASTARFILFANAFNKNYYKESKVNE